ALGVAAACPASRADGARAPASSSRHGASLIATVATMAVPTASAAGRRRAALRQGAGNYLLLSPPKTFRRPGQFRTAPAWRARADGLPLPVHAVSYARRRRSNSTVRR